jgi:hypothetical protein
VKHFPFHTHKVTEELQDHILAASDTNWLGYLQIIQILLILHGISE